MPGSPDFEKFRFSFFEDPYSARDGLNMAALIALQNDEREAAETMLVDLLPDMRAILGLSALRSRRAEPWLRTAFEAEINALRDGDVGTLIATAHALWRLEAAPRYAAAICKTLGAPEWTNRMDAAMALAEMPTEAVKCALVKALDDEEPLVRHHASCALMAIHGMTADRKDLQSPIYKIMADEPGRREAGRAELLSLVSNHPLLVAAP